MYAANQRAQVNAVADAVGGEGAAGPGLKRHAGKTVRQFRQADGPAPARRIMQHRAVPLILTSTTKWLNSQCKIQGVSAR